ncbi:PqqD family protein [Clostridium botulinum]|nr:PqqD family protein [Clostridium botulinum]NFR15912.1 PqqD family protein [Clostridium botulinum]NFR45123.1 PqqD family protein [Clostridium botulinum]NFS52019.1 PqqD family protein [Clostridium botulinum]
MRLIKNSSLVETRKNDELTILNMDNGKYYGLQDTSLEIWGLLEKYKNENELLNQALNIYNDDKKIITKEIKEFISNLIQEELLVYEEV